MIWGMPSLVWCEEVGTSTGFVGLMQSKEGMYKINVLSVGLFVIVKWSCKAR